MAIESFERKLIASSNIDCVSYDADEELLEIEFVSGAIYLYRNVPSGVVEDFMSSPSKGRFFHQNIKGVYTTRCLTK